MRSRLARVAGAVVVVGSIVAAIVIVRQQWGEVRAARTFPAWWAVTAAVAAHLVADGVLVQVWRRVLATARITLAYGIAAWVWVVGQLTRYTFFSGVQVGGRAVAGRAYGVSVVAGATSTIVEIAWQSSFTAMIALATAPWVLRAAGEWTWLAAVAVAPAAALLALHVAPAPVLAGVARAVGRLRSGLGASVAAVDLDRGDAAAITGWFTVNTALRLAAFVTLFASLGGSLRTDVAVAVGAWALGQLAGRIAVFAPGGIGPQEGVSALVLGPTLGPAALVLVGVMRVTEIVAELAFLGISRALRGS